MILPKTNLQHFESDPLDLFSVAFHPSFYQVQEKLKKWATRFSHVDDPSIFSDLFILYLTSSKKFLDHRSRTHLFRLALSIFFMKKKLSRSTIFSPHQRNLEIRWIPAILQFPFSSKPVLGCLIGFNVLDRYELFDEENILLILQKYLPQLRLVKDSSYCHASQHKNLKLFYLEIEKKDGQPFSLQEQILLKVNLEEKVTNTIQTLSPAIFMCHNEEETYKNILVLSQEIQSIDDLPQVSIALDLQNGKEIVFLVTLVYISPLPLSLLDESEGTLVSDSIVAVGQLENRTIEAHVFRIHLPRDISLQRSDGSLDFYSARQKAAALIQKAIGEFRDYNGGIIIKRQELLHSFKGQFPEIAKNDPELIESFFYGITPIAKQVLLKLENLTTLFSCFLENRKNQLPEGVPYAFKVHRQHACVFLIVHANRTSMKEIITTALKEQISFKTQDVVYNFLQIEKETFFSCLLQNDSKNIELFLENLQQVLDHGFKKVNQRQVLRIAMDDSSICLDPRIAGDNPSIDIIRLLFEGLTRFNQNGEIENAIAESIEISPDLKNYTFKLRPSFWNDGSPLTAYDFEYAWKKILSPSFKTPFAHLFYPIKNAQEAKEGRVSLDEIGIHVQDQRTLKVELVNPIPYFLQLTTSPLYSPVHRFKDREHPEWPYQSEKNYPCNGPFQLKINQPIQGYQLKKNPFYFDAEQITLDQIFLTHMNPVQAIEAFQKKKIEWVGNPFGIWDLYTIEKKDIEKESQVTLPNYRACWWIFNTSHFPFNHPKLRRAFAYAVQRGRLLANFFTPCESAYTLLLPSYRNRDVGVFPEYDLEKARRLFHEALHELGIRKGAFRVNLLCNEVGMLKYVALALKNQLQECFDIECELSPSSWSKQFKKLTSGHFEMGVMNWQSWIDDPVYTLSFFKWAKEGSNFSKWEDSEFQQIIDFSDQVIDPKKRLAQLYRAEQILGREMPIIPLFHFPYQALVRKDLQINKQTSLAFSVARCSYTKQAKGKEI